MAAAQDDKFLRAVKLFNVIAGVLIVVGSLVLVTALVLRAGNDEEAAVEETAAALPAGDPIELGLPVESKVLSTQLRGDRALLHVALPSGAERLLAIDLVAGTFREIRLSDPQP